MRKRGEIIQQIGPPLDTQVSQTTDNIMHENVKKTDYLKCINTPENFQAGKVKHFIEKWRTITTDKAVLDALNGYQLRFHTLPPERNNCNNPNFSANEKIAISLEIDTFLSKRHCGRGVSL